MVGMQMANKDVVDKRCRHLQSDCMADAAVPQIKKETSRLRSVVAKLHQHGRAFL